MLLCRKFTTIFLIALFSVNTSLICTNKKQSNEKKDCRKKLTALRTETSKTISNIKKEYYQAVSSTNQDARKQHAQLRDHVDRDIKKARNMLDRKQRIVTIKNIQNNALKQHQAINTQRKNKLADAVNLRTAKLKDAHYNHIKQSSIIKISK